MVLKHKNIAIVAWWLKVYCWIQLSLFMCLFIINFTTIVTPQQLLNFCFYSEVLLKAFKPTHTSIPWLQGTAPFQFDHKTKNKIRKPCYQWVCVRIKVGIFKISSWNTEHLDTKRLKCQVGETYRWVRKWSWSLETVGFQNFIMFQSKVKNLLLCFVTPG